MPGVKSILRLSTGNSPHLVTLRGKAMQCAGLIGEAVGDRQFHDDAMEIMQLLIGAMVITYSLCTASAELHYYVTVHCVFDGELE